MTSTYPFTRAYALKDKCPLYAKKKTYQQRSKFPEDLSFEFLKTHIRSTSKWEMATKYSFGEKKEQNAIIEVWHMRVLPKYI